MLCIPIFTTFVKQINVNIKNYFDLKGYVAVVTGASTGLGLQMAKAITEKFGVEVLPFARDITKTEMVENEAFHLSAMAAQASSTHAPSV